MAPDGFTATLTGSRQLKRQLAHLDAAFRARALEGAVVAGALPIVNQTKRNVHKVTGTLARSYHIGGHTDLAADFRSGEGYSDIGGATVRRDEAEVLIGSNLAYARREEFGFVGRDRLGRRYNFTGHPHLRPAFDERKDEAVREIGGALAEILVKALR